MQNTESSPLRSTISSVRVRLWLALLLIAIVPVAVWWVERAVDAPSEGWFAGTSTFPIGSDVAVFHAAGTMVRIGSADDLYDPDAFQAQLSSEGFFEVSENSLFGNPPIFALLFAPLSGISVETTWYVVTLVNLAALGGGLALLGVRRPWQLGLLLLATLPAYFAITFGQPTMVWLLGFAYLYRLLDRGALRGAGLLLGLLALLKPTLAIGTFVWFVSDRSRRSAAVWAVGSALTGVLVTFPWLGRAWLAYPSAVAEFGTRHSTAEAQWAQFSPLGLAQALLPGSLLPWLAYGVVAGIPLVLFVRAIPRDWRIGLAASIVLSLWVAPQVVAYDWLLLVVPWAILWRARPDVRPRLLMAATGLALIAPWSVILGGVTRDAFDVTLQVAIPGFVLVVWWLARAVYTVDGSSPQTAAPA